MHYRMHWQHPVTMNRKGSGPQDYSLIPQDGLMSYRFAANAVMCIHFGFLAFALFGGFLLWWWPSVLWFHVAVLVWAVGISTIGWTCPLTPLENLLRAAGGGDTYQGGFIEHYITARFYPDGLPSHVLALLGGLVLALSLLAYGMWFFTSPAAI